MISRPSTPWTMSIVRLLSITLLTMLTLVSPGTGVFAQQADGPERFAQANTDGHPVDLPAMALRPADFAAEGRDGYGQSFSFLADRPRKVAEFVDSLDLDTGNPDGDILAGAGADRAYVLQLGRLLSGETDLAHYSQSAISFILEFENDDDADDALDEMEDQWLDTRYLITVPQAGTVGDKSFYLEGTAINANSGETDERTMMVFQIENLVAGVVIMNHTDDDLPTRDLTENLALRQADRIEAVLDGDEGGTLSHRVLRLRVDGDQATTDTYIVIDGVAICEDIDVVTPGTCEQRQAAADERQIEDYYYVSSRVAGDYFQGIAEGHFWVYLRSFSSDEAAEVEFLQVATSQPDDAVVAMHNLGDESVQIRDSEGPWLRNTLHIRLDNTVVSIGHRTEASLASAQGWTFEPSETATLALAEHQVACLEGTASCAEPVRIPREMIPAELEGVSSLPGEATIAAILNRRTG